MTTTFKSRRRRPRLPFVRLLANRMNHRLAGLHIDSRPQLAILAFDHIGLRINLDGRYEDDTLSALGDFLADQRELRAGCALDIGANVGNHTLFLSRLFAHVHAFEPHPVLSQLLAVNAGLADNITVHPFGLSDRDGDVAFLTSAGNQGGSRIVNTPSGGDGATVAVPVRRLDALQTLSRLPISFLKIDVEGHELAVLEGAAQTIARNLPVIVFEAGAGTIKDGTSPVLDWLRDRDYRFLVMTPNFFFGGTAPARALQKFCQMLFGISFVLKPATRLASRHHDLVIGLPGGGRKAG